MISVPFSGGGDIRLFERAERLVQTDFVQRLKLLPSGGSFSAPVLPIIPNFLVLFMAFLTPGCGKYM